VEPAGTEALAARRVTVEPVVMVVPRLRVAPLRRPMEVLAATADLAVLQAGMAETGAMAAMDLPKVTARQATEVWEGLVEQRRQAFQERMAQMELGAA